MITKYELMQIISRLKHEIHLIPCEPLIQLFIHLVVTGLERCHVENFSCNRAPLDKSPTAASDKEPKHAGANWIDCTRNEPQLLGMLTESKKRAPFTRAFSEIGANRALILQMLFVLLHVKASRRESGAITPANNCSV